MPRIGSRGAISMAVRSEAGIGAFIVITSKVGCKDVIADGLYEAQGHKSCVENATHNSTKGQVSMSDLSQVTSSLDESKFVTFPGSPYRLYQPFPPAGDQPEAIDKLVEGINDGLFYQTLLGVT